jgi:branched-chain amino acid aminotransferase
METKLVEIKVKETTFPKWKEFDFSKAEFGYSPTDHMFIAEYSDSKWRNSRIEPFKELNISPFSSAFHYGQTVFEGMKAFRMLNGQVAVFRPYDHAERFNKSLSRMSMPDVPVNLFVEAVSTLVDIDRNWVSGIPESSLYIRPFMFANDARLGVRVSDNYLFMVVCSPALSYYSSPLKVKVETTFSRACNGGTGYTKCGGNYGGSFYPYQLAKKEGYDQVIWTDAKTHEFVEESGTMNLGFIYNKTFFTPPLGETILRGITRDSILKIAPSVGLKVIEKPISLTQLEEMFASKNRTEAFGIGTAATIAPINEITMKGKIYKTFIGSDAYMNSIKKRLEDIRYGLQPDEFGWNKIIH